MDYIEANKASSSAASNEIDNELSTRGCTWGQFCYIMQLFCTNRAHHIPRLVYHILRIKLVIMYCSLYIKYAYKSKVFRITKEESIQNGSSFASEEFLDESGVVGGGGGGGRLRSDSRHRSSRGSDGKPADFFNLDQGSFTENSFGFDNFFNEGFSFFFFEFVINFFDLSIYIIFNEYTCMYLFSLLFVFYSFLFFLQSLKNGTS